MATDNTRLADAIRFLRQFKLRVSLLSTLLGIPCLWHRRIEAGDLASSCVTTCGSRSSLKRAGAGALPGEPLGQRSIRLHTVAPSEFSWVFHRGENCRICLRVDFLLGRFCVRRRADDRLPWFLTPCIAMLAYGYSFTMGFMNYYLSLGLACSALRCFGARGEGNGFMARCSCRSYCSRTRLGLCGSSAFWLYVKLRANLRGGGNSCCHWQRWRVSWVYWFMAQHAAKYLVDWDRGPFYFYNGAINWRFTGSVTSIFAGAAFLFGFFSVAVDLYAGRRDTSR